MDAIVSHFVGEKALDRADIIGLLELVLEALDRTEDLVAAAHIDCAMQHLKVDALR